MASPNAEIVVKDKKGHVYTSYSVEQYETPVTLSCSMASRYINWSIAPQDKGVTMYDDRINIDTSKILPKTVFTITAVDASMARLLIFRRIRQMIFSDSTSTLNSCIMERSVISISVFPAERSVMPPSLTKPIT